MSNGAAMGNTTWTEADFDAMGWHDNAVHAVAVEQLPDAPGRLLLDLDYKARGSPSRSGAASASPARATVRSRYLQRWRCGWCPCAS